jgi:hypothetical protein
MAGKLNDPRGLVNRFIFQDAGQAAGQGDADPGAHRVFVFLFMSNGKMT